MIHPETRVSLEPNYNGPLRITVTLGEWNDDGDGDELVRTVEGVLMFADRGAFVRETAHPADAVMKIIAARHAPPVQFIWDVDARSIDHRFTRVLANQLIMFHHAFCPITNATVEMLQPPKPTLPRALPELDEVEVEAGHVYPPRSSTLGFAVSHIAVADYKRERRAEVEFSGVIDDDTLVALREWFEPWPHLLDCAYAATPRQLEDGAHAIFDVLTDIIDEGTIETAIGVFGGSEQAWNGYLNLVGRAEREFGKVVAVRIY